MLEVGDTEACLDLCWSQSYGSRLPGNLMEEQDMLGWCCCELFHPIHRLYICVNKDTITSMDLHSKETETWVSTGTPGISHRLETGMYTTVTAMEGNNLGHFI